MGYVLDEDGQGLERTSPEWCEKQAESIRKYIDGDNEYIDVDGVVMLLTEMAELRYSAAESMALRLMEHLLYVAISPDNDAVRHWLHEIDTFVHNFSVSLGVTTERPEGNTNIKNKLQGNWDKIYAKAVKKVRSKAKSAFVFNFAVNKLPAAPPWQVQDFLTKTDDELVAIIK